MEEIIIGGLRFFVQYPDLLRPLSRDELSRLAASIEEYGIHSPIVVDESGNVIDGANRLRIASDLGLNCLPVQVLPGLNEQAKRDLALDLNSARRHLTEDDLAEVRRRRAQRVAARRQQGASTRQIASEEGVSQSQVVADLKSASQLNSDCSTERNGAHQLNSHCSTGKVTGTDGKTYRASRPKKVDTDEFGVPIGETVKDAFKSLEIYRELDRLIQRGSLLVSDLAKSPGGEHLRASLRLETKTKDGVKVERHRSRELDALEAILRYARPRLSVCPYCHVQAPSRIDQRSKKCRCCCGLGWVSERGLDGCPPEYLAAVEKLKGGES